MEPALCLCSSRGRRWWEEATGQRCLLKSWEKGLLHRRNSSRTCPSLDESFRKSIYRAESGNSSPWQPNAKHVAHEGLETFLGACDDRGPSLCGASRELPELPPGTRPILGRNRGASLEPWGVPAALGRGERPRVCTWEEIRARLWEVFSALGMRQQQLIRQQSSFPLLGKAEPGGSEVSAWGEQRVRGGQAWGPACGCFGNVFSHDLLLSVSSQFQRVWQRGLRVG